MSSSNDMDANTDDLYNAPKSTRGKTDPAWKHCSIVEKMDAKGVMKNMLLCMYCQKEIKGGGISRVKHHLARVSGGGVEFCKKVPSEVENEMKMSIAAYNIAKKQSQSRYEDQFSYGCGPGIDDEHNEVLCAPPISIRRPNKRQGSQSGSPVDSYFMSRTTPGAQPTIKSVMQCQEAKDKVDLAITKWMIDASIPFNATNSKLYQPMIDAIASYGSGYKAPTYHDVRGKLLGKCVKEVKQFTDSFRGYWKETGCTIMGDGWTDQNGKSLINFLVYCPRGTIFLRSVDASEASKTGELLYKLFREIVLEVGAENVVQLVTDNASNYVLAGKLLESEFPSISWSPCGAHCLNLMFQDIGKLKEVDEIVKKAAAITKYAYNHCFVLDLMRKNTDGREILRPAPTRFATNFIALQSILSQKDALRCMVTSREWTQSSHAKDVNGKKFVNNILDANFWSECAIIVKLVEPLIYVLRMVDSDERPAMGYLYSAIHVAREEMVKRFQKKKRRVEPYLNIVDSRWDRQLHKRLHAAGFWFNPSNQYNSDLMAKHIHVSSSILDVIEKYGNGNDDLTSKLTSEMRIYKNAEGDFGRKTAINDRTRMLPAEWWSCYGNSAPNLQKLAIRVLSQTCSSSGCERNWSIFEHIHSKKRNRLEHQRLDNLVFVHYNLRLQQRLCWMGRNYDPISFEDWSFFESWVLVDEPPALSTDEIATLQQLRDPLCQENIDYVDIDLNEYLDLNDDDDVEPRLAEDGMVGGFFTMDVHGNRA